MKKYIAEMIGTFVLVVMGCGTAMLVGCDAFVGTGYLLTALAFGLSIVAMAYSIGNISGCHVNPAVSISMYFSGRMEGRECGMYCLFQCIGAIIGSAFLAALFGAGAMFDLTGGLGANGVDGVGGNFALATIVESVLTFIFVLTILGVTSEKAKHGSLAGLVIGLTLTFVHIFGIGLTGTSVNPARSLGPALLDALGGNFVPMSCLWVFIIGPIAGAILAALLYKYLESDDFVPAEVEIGTVKAEAEEIETVEDESENDDVVDDEVDDSSETEEAVEPVSVVEAAVVA